MLETDPPAVGDLDWIVMKALEKPRPPQNRQQPGKDVQRYLADEPVVAARLAISTAAKLARRNKLAPAPPEGGGSLSSAWRFDWEYLKERKRVKGLPRRPKRPPPASSAAAKPEEILMARGSDYTVRQLLDDFPGPDQPACRPA